LKTQGKRNYRPRSDAPGALLRRRPPRTVICIFHPRRL